VEGSPSGKSLGGKKGRRSRLKGKKKKSRDGARLKVSQKKKKFAMAKKGSEQLKGLRRKPCSVPVNKGGEEKATTGRADTTRGKNEGGNWANNKGPFTRTKA